MWKVAEQMPQFAIKSFSSPYFHNLDRLRKFTLNFIYISIFYERKEQKILSSDVFMQFLTFRLYPLY